MIVPVIISMWLLSRCSLFYGAVPGTKVETVARGHETPESSIEQNAFDEQTEYWIF